MTTATPTAAPVPATDPAPEPGEAKRQRFTLTRARDLHARLDAITLRSDAALAELAAVGIEPGYEGEHVHPVKRELQNVADALGTIRDQGNPAKAKAEQIVGLLDL